MNTVTAPGGSWRIAGAFPLLLIFVAMSCVDTWAGSGSDLWSLKPVSEAEPPTVSEPAWNKHPVDQFIASRWEDMGLRPVALADKRVLLRRATFDLTGLPPTPEEIDSFLSDRSDNAFEKLVDRLLATQQYGEKWARHWLDLVRYADTSGCNSDFPVPSAYRYRNYVIEAFMRDKPYDEFIREQIAGDLLSSASESQRHERIIATGYLAISRRFGSRAAEFHQTLEDTIDNVGKAFLGLSLGCARCHDHKFDPVTAKDYYALYGILDSTRFAFPGTEIYRHTKDFVPLAAPEEGKKLLEWQAELASIDDRIEELVKELKPLQAAREKEKQPEPRENASPSTELKGERTYEVVKLEMAELKEKLERLERRPPKIEKAFAVSEGTVKNARIHKKGEPNNKGDEVPRGFLGVLGGHTVPESCEDSGRRHLADWIADPQNPLTARVMVNRIWHHHFGRGIVATPNDFGSRGAPPTHPELLDFLAAKFVEEGWSIKKMHKLLMLSRTYQLSSAHDEHNASIDNNNEFHWRFNSRRLSAEEIRDSIMMVSGELDLAMGGEHPFPPEREWRYTQHQPFVADYPTDKRSIYLLQQRIRKNPLLESFDAPDANAPMAERPQTTTPLQALFLMNSQFMHKHSDSFAVRVGLAFESEANQIDYACRLAYGRPATGAELAEAKEFLASARAHLVEIGTPLDRQRRNALGTYLRALLSSNEFLFVD